MTIRDLKTVLLCGLLGAGSCIVSFAHGDKDEAHYHSAETRLSPGALLTGQGEFVFSWDQELTAKFPAAAKRFEKRMHGGFNEDPETGIVYTAIPGYGLCSISPDLKTWKKLGSDPKLRGNVHGIVFFVHKGEKHLALAQQSNKRVLITDLYGQIVAELSSPKGDEFDFEPANTYYKSKKPKFTVTDVTYLNGKLYAVTGYSKGDFVLTAEEKDGQWSWGKVAWGGKGTNPGQFQTAHGIYAHEGFIYVANRAAFQVVKFTAEGTFLGNLKDIPTGSMVCNVAYFKDHFFFCPLKKVGDQKSAPIYAHTGEKLVSTIIPGDLNIPVLNNIHHAWPHEVTEKDGTKQLYLLVHGWNKGKYAVLKQK
ncbi:MAG: hypothetical protein HRT88_06815 [Lentisphaeraceae bacterium]|nr:hypothetical protein [Lentisphaeraceae bacterium]